MKIVEDMMIPHSLFRAKYFFSQGNFIQSLPQNRKEFDPKTYNATEERADDLCQLTEYLPAVQTSLIIITES